MANTKQMVAVCTACQQRHKLPYHGAKIGEQLQPYPGSGNYGRCLRCQRETLVVVEIPEEPLKKPVGWTKIPEQ